MTPPPPNELTMVEALARIRAGRLAPAELVEACLDRIARRDPEVRAWLHVDADAARAAARQADPAAPLAGIPVGIKDIIETAGMPTTCNSPVYAERWSSEDASCVAVLRHFGAIVLGKTDTVEFASGGRRALTRNPHDLRHTPGASSSGSAAAVADFMVPLALGTQTAGSIIRPAVFNGVYGFKPTFGAVNLEGIKTAAPSLDTVGWFTRSCEDLALVAQCLRVGDWTDFAVPALEGLRVGFCRSPYWARAEAAGRDGLAAVAGRLAEAGARVRDLVLPAPFDGLAEAVDIIMGHEGQSSLLAEYLVHYDKLAPDFRLRVENARGITARDFTAAQDLAARCRGLFDPLFGDGLDVILTLGAPGLAPRIEAGTGDPIFCSLWSALHAPCLAVPAGFGAGGLPFGVQLVGPRFGDARLIGLAAAIAAVIDPGQAEARARQEVPATW
ncbi:amidase [Zavarzinia sp.]|uniref:amidase n=1 Tax=Zavarzinia sp. TaxID=2027920 RepID=UPI003562C028